MMGKLLRLRWILCGFGLVTALGTSFGAFAAPECAALATGAPFSEVLNADEALAEYRFWTAEIERRATVKNVRALVSIANQAQQAFQRLHNAEAAKTGGLQAFIVAPEYIGESNGRSLEHLLDDENERNYIRYYSEKERADLRVTFNQGRAYWQTGEMVRGLKKHRFVMDLKGNFYLEPPRGRGHLRHSSFLAGGPVSTAGLVSFDAEGNISYIDRHSGHYAPNGRSLLRAVDILTLKGMNIPDAAIDPDDARRYQRRVSPFLHHQATD